MSYKVGDMVVYPRHGAAKVEAITERTVKGVTREYLQLSVLSSDGWSSTFPWTMPRRSACVTSFRIRSGQGIRHPADPDHRERDELVSPLQAERRKIATGDVNKIAEVVRDLAQRDVDEHGLSAGEKRMLTKARAILTSEIALSEKIDEAEAQRLLDVNLGYEPAQPGDDKHHTAEPEEAAADTLARVEAEKKSKKK